MPSSGSVPANLSLGRPVPLEDSDDGLTECPVVGSLIL